MNQLLTLLLLLISVTIRAQQTAYNDFDVQQPAEPRGGHTALRQFMSVNVRKPFLAQVANKKGMVILRGIVEPDGRIAEVTVARSLRPDCDREAVRAFSLFNAWKPAQKDGKAVRQVVTYPLQFGTNEPVQYENGVAIRYFDNAFQPVAAPDSAVLRSETPADTLGIPKGSMVFFKRKGDKWKEEVKMDLLRTVAEGRTATNGFMYKIGHVDANGRPFGKAVVVDDLGNVYEENYYDLDRKLMATTRRNQQGMVMYHEAPNSDQVTISQWYRNGQLREKVIRIRNQAMAPPAKPVSEQMLVYYDSTGNAIVSEGNGHYLVTNKVRSQLDSSQFTTYTEQGLYEKGLKQGRWVGKHADGSSWYEEFYENGNLTLGRTMYKGLTDTLQYKSLMQQPEFEGGMKGLNQFLASNMRYPTDAQKMGAQGRVFVSFVVCQDGTLCDFNVLKGAHPSLDAEALRVTKLMSGRWKPGLQRGRPVRVKYNMPMNFSLN